MSAELSRLNTCIFMVSLSSFLFGRLLVGQGTPEATECGTTWRYVVSFSDDSGGRAALGFEILSSNRTLWHSVLSCEGP